MRGVSQHFSERGMYTAWKNPHKTQAREANNVPVWLEWIWFSLWPSFPQCKSSFQNGENHLPGTNRATVQSSWGFYRCEVLQCRTSLLVGMKMVQPAYMLACHRAKHKPTTTGVSNTTSRYYCPWEIKLYIYTNSHIQMLITAFFRVAKNGEQVYPSADRRINKLQSIHDTEYFSCERQQPLTYAHRWISNVLCYIDLHLIQFCLFDILQKTKLKRQRILSSGGLGAGWEAAGREVQALVT